MKTKNNYYELKNFDNEIELSKINDTNKLQKYINKNNGNLFNLPDNITLIKSYVFSKNKFKKIKIPYGVKKINLSMIGTFENIKIIYGDYYSISVKEHTPEGQNQRCLKIDKIYDRDLFNKYLIEHNGNAPLIPEGIKFIGEYVFKDIDLLKTITLPNSVTALCKQAFANTGLEKINHSTKMIYYGDEVFANCKKLEKINIYKSMRFIKRNVFKGCNKNINISIFEEKNINLDEFHYNGNFQLWVDNYNSKIKTLRTKNSFYILLNNSIVKVLNRDDIIPNKSFNKHLGLDYISADRIFEENAGYKALKFYEICKNKEKDIPIDFIITSTHINDIKNYFDNIDTFNFILNKIRKISSIQTVDNNNKKVGRLSLNQYELLYKMAILAGLYDLKNKNKVIYLFTQIIFNLDKNTKKSLNLNLEEYEKIFKDINEIKEVKYNEEFANYFLYNDSNLKKLINKIRNGKKHFLLNIINNCGFSKIKYEHDGVFITSAGKMHDLWINYKINNNKKEKNIGIEKTCKTLSFIEWAINFGDISNVVSNMNINKEEKEILSKFNRYYKTEEPFIRLLELYEKSKDILPYIYFNEKDIKVTENKFNISKCGFKKVYRIFKIAYLNEKNLNIISKYNKYNKYQLKNYTGKIMKKNDMEVAYANCLLGNCSNVMGTGCKYVYESYLDKDCQPFLIYNGNIPIASFRMYVNREKQFAYISCFEVSGEVKYNYSKKEKDIIIEIFWKLVDNFIYVYNNENANKVLNYVTLGQNTHCGINEYLELFFEILKEPIILNDEKMLSKLSLENHFLVWSKNLKLKKLINNINN